MKDLIEKFWQFFNERKFAKAKELLHEDFVGTWKTTEEVFDSREAFIKVNKAYPGNWQTELRRLELTETGAVSLTFLYFEDNEDRFYATTFYEFKDNLIYRIEEYWATCEEAPEWRKKYTS